MSDPQRWMAAVAPSDVGGFVAFEDYLELKAELAELQADAERWLAFVELWLCSTELSATQDEDGGYSITVIEPAEALLTPGRWTGDNPDAAIDTARAAKKGK